MINWLLGSGWKILAGLTIVGFLAYVGKSVYDDYNETIERNIQLTERNAKLSLTNEANEKTIQKIRENIERLRIINEEVNRQIRDAEEESDRLRELLSEHDLEYLSRNKPGLIERRINEATDRAFDDIECVTDPQCVRD